MNGIQHQEGENTTARDAAMPRRSNPSICSWHHLLPPSAPWPSPPAAASATWLALPAGVNTRTPRQMRWGSRSRQIQAQSSAARHRRALPCSLHAAILDGTLWLCSSESGTSVTFSARWETWVCGWRAGEGRTAKQRPPPTDAAAAVRIPPRRVVAASAAPTSSSISLIFSRIPMAPPSYVRTAPPGPPVCLCVRSALAPPPPAAAATAAAARGARSAAAAAQACASCGSRRCLELGEVR